MSGASSNRIQRSASLVEPFGALGDVVKGFQIWTSRAPSVLKNPSLCFIKCEVLKGSTKTVLKCRELHTNNNDTFSINMKDAYNCNIDVNGAEFKDIGLIPHKNVPCVMDFLKQRYQKGIIYTYANPLLITLNPFTNLNNATSQIAQQYRDAPDVSALPPHIFATARTAVDCLYSLRKSQTIIVSGESGAGKTEASKQIMHYLASCKVNAANSVQDAVLAANPVLEAFGNAKTIRNNNSSRFGRFVRLCINPNYGIENGHIENFLLEKTRIVKQDSDERNYHIFYQFLKGATPEQRERYSLLPMEQYTFLNPSCHDVTAIDDVEDWAITMSSFKSMDFSDADMNSVLSILAGVLLLGNINIDGGDVSAISKSSRDAFKLFCKLLLLNEQQCEEGLCVKISSAGSDVIRGYWNEKEAEVLKQSFAKALYERLFRWIVSRLNTTMASKTLMKEFIGMLDIFGFEVFANNSIEQLFINITNEMLQNIFINIVFKKEQEIYRDEGISTRSLVWTSNDSLISMLIGKSFSLTSCLEDQCLAPGGTDENFLSFAYRTIKNPAFLRGKASPSTTFIVAHTIGEIQYSVKGFVNKNKDILRSELVQIAQNSEDPVVCIMFENVIVQKGKLAKGQLNGSQMINQLNHLIACIKATETHFVRCVKPNEDKLPLTFDSSKVLVQLTALSIIEALDLRSLGFSYRRPFSEFSTQFRFLDLGIYNHETDSRIATEKLLEKACIPSSDYQIGRTMVFIKDPGVKLLMKKQRVAVATWYPVISLLEAMVLKKKYGETVELGIPGLKRFQANIRRLIYS